MAAGPVVQRLLRDFPTQVRLVIKPLPSDRNNAVLAAEAALAAWGQGRYWPMAEKLFKNSPRFDREDLVRYARESGLDMDRFTREIDSGRYKDIIARDQKLADRLGVFGTPTFFINGKMTVGTRPYLAFKALVEKALARQ